MTQLVARGDALWLSAQLWANPQLHLDSNISGEDVLWVSAHPWGNTQLKLGSAISREDVLWSSAQIFFGGGHVAQD